MAGPSFGKLIHIPPTQKACKQNTKDQQKRQRKAVHASTLFLFSAGNAAGTGARIALLNAEARREIESIVPQINKIETATEADFQSFFVEAMSFPHKVDSFDRLFCHFTKPKASAGAAADNGRPRRNRRRG